MRRTLLAATIGAAIGAGGLSLANHEGHGRESVKVLSAADVIEKLDGKEARVTTVEVTFGPEVAGKPHRHPGPIFGYVLEGEFELGLDDEPVKTLKAGETFYRAVRGTASGVSQPEYQDQDESAGRDLAPTRREGDRYPVGQGMNLSSGKASERMGEEHAP